MANNTRITRTRDGAIINCTPDQLILVDEHFGEPFIMEAAKNAEPAADAGAFTLFCQRSRWYGPGAAAWQANFGLTLKAFREGALINWHDKQVGLLTTFDYNRGVATLAAMADDQIRGISCRDAGKTPAEAQAKLAATFVDAGQRAKVIELLCTCYKSGLYAPLGSMTKDGNLNEKNLRKFLNLQAMSLQIKETIVAVFMGLEIGVKGGYNLNQYIKAIYAAKIVNEDRLAANKGLLDYYFFARGENTIGYWIEYAAYHHATIDSINNGSRGRGGMSHKRKADFPFDQLNNPVCNPDSPNIPWERIKVSNLHTVTYFCALAMERAEPEEGIDYLAGAYLRDVKRSFALADRARAAINLKILGRIATIPELWRVIKAVNKPIKVKLPQNLFTPVELAHARTMGVEFKDGFVAAAMAGGPPDLP